MKKVIFAVLIAALAVLAVTCDSAVMTGNLSGQVTPPPVEPEWTTVSINIGDSDGRARAMTQALNSGSVDYYEVVFNYNGTTVRDTKEPATGTVPSGWTLSVPAVNYTPTTGNGQVVLYAGKKGTPNILIAIGTRSSGGNFTNGDTSITLTLTAITNANAFSLTGATPAGNATAPDGLSAGTTVPIHSIKTTLGTTNATYTFGLPANHGVQVESVGAVTSQAATVSGTGLVLTTSVPTPNTGSTNGVFSFTIDSGSVEGYSKVFIAVPVHAINQTSTRGTSYVTWSLQGGLLNSTLDTAAGSTGGAVLIRVTLPGTPSVTIERGGPASPVPKGWDETTTPYTWTVSTTAALPDNIVLKATADDFTDKDNVTYKWKIATSATLDPDTDPDITTTNVPLVQNPTTGTITIPYTSSKLDTVDTFYVYCYVEDPSVATEKVATDPVMIKVQAEAVDYETNINLPTTW